MFTGLNAFPLTPLRDETPDLPALAHLVQRIVTASVDSLTVLGSTGSYVYLDRAERAAVVRTAVREAGRTPVVAGIGALRTRDVRRYAEDAQQAGATGLLLAPVSYQRLTRDDVYQLFCDVTADLSVPLAVYDNPGTTHFTFDDDLYVALARLPRVSSIKIPGVPRAQNEADERIRTLRSVLPEHVFLGISGDPVAAQGLNAGCDAWYSVLAGTLLSTARLLTDHAAGGEWAELHAASHRLRPLWDLFDEHGSYRVIAAVAEHLGLVGQNSLPRPVRGLGRTDRDRVAAALHDLGITADDEQPRLTEDR